MFFLEQKENLLQISLVPHRSKFFNFLFQIVKWDNFVETLVYNTQSFAFASPENQKNWVQSPGPKSQNPTPELLSMKEASYKQTQRAKVNQNDTL